MKIASYFINVILIAVILGSINFKQAPTIDYPVFWRDAPKDSLQDSWGQTNRECTSYVAWKVYETFHYNTQGWGRAQLWVTDAIYRNVDWGYTPRVHSVAVNTSFKPGHVMWVEHVNANGTIAVSQYNADNKGDYSEATVSTKGLKFIYFN